MLIKAVLQAIPTHQMSCFEIPKKILEEINKLATKFWWGSKDEGQKIHWASWVTLCDGKFKGGYGFTDLNQFNLALSAKLG